MEKVKKDDIIKVTVTGVQKYGAFAQSENYDGLIHISEISDGFVKDINDYINLGETISAKIIEVDDESCHVKLSIKNIKSKPKKRNRRNIEEVGSGFGILRENLEDWIEIAKKNKKN